MPRTTDHKQGVVLLDTRQHTPEHEHCVHLKLAERLAQLLHTQVVTPVQPPTRGANRIRKKSYAKHSTGTYLYLVLPRRFVIQ